MFWHNLRLCGLHNEVNKRLEKPDFDCAHLSDEYDCGCGDEPVSEKPAAAANTQAVDDDFDPMDLEDDFSRDSLTGADMIRGGR